MVLRWLEAHGWQKGWVSLDLARVGWANLVIVLLQQGCALRLCVVDREESRPRLQKRR